MAPKLIAVRPAGDFRLELTFDDGLKSIFDFKERIFARTGIWKLLQNAEYFKQVRLDPELETIVWPNGADICPDLLYSLASGRPLALPEEKNAEVA